MCQSWETKLEHTEYWNVYLHVIVSTGSLSMFDHILLLDLYHLSCWMHEFWEQVRNALDLSVDFWSFFSLFLIFFLPIDISLIKNMLFSHFNIVLDKLIIFLEKYFHFQFKVGYCGWLGVDHVGNCWFWFLRIRYTNLTFMKCMIDATTKLSRQEFTWPLWKLPLWKKKWKLMIILLEKFPLNIIVRPISPICMHHPLIPQWLIQLFLKGIYSLNKLIPHELVEPCF
jgi:hypothetical protein